MHIGNKVRNLLILIILLPLTVLAVDKTQSLKTEFTMQYGEFIAAVETKDWRRIATFESKTIKCGFGPEEEGPGCMKKVLSRNNGCLDEILFVLKQGCKINSSLGSLSCTSPPQWADESIIIMGARVRLNFNRKSKRMLVSHLICGGD